MPLTMLKLGVSAIVHDCRAEESTRKFLEGLGIVPGSFITIISENGGNLIVNVKESRLALSRGIAQQVIVQI